MHPELEFQAQLAEKYKYKPLPKDLSTEVRERYWVNLPETFKAYYITMGFDLVTSSGMLISKGYNRIVIGDYGAFIEIRPDQMVESNLKVKEGQEYRYQEEYKTCKFYWLTAKDESDIKVYHQKRTVGYADYKADMYYVSPYEVMIDQRRYNVSSF